MKQTKQIEALVTKYNKGKQFPITIDSFDYHAKRYIKAIKEKRMLCSINSVSASGMSRQIKFEELDKFNNEYLMLDFYQFFDILGYTKIAHSDYFRISGCGMDMIFHTNYSIIHRLHQLGYINKKTCEVLAQKTPHVI